MKILITGATGMVGKEVGKKLVAKGHEIFVVSRNAESVRLRCPFPCEVIEGSLEKEALRDSRLRDIEAVIHLAGESVAESRWSKEKKRQIYESRALGTKHLVESLKDANLKVFVSTSASGFYGDREDEVLTEDSMGGTDFLAHVCQDWERPLSLAQAKNLFPKCRYAILRVGVVLSPFAGAITKMIAPFRRGVGGAVGSGQQWMSWIHIEDLSNLYVQTLEDSRFEGLLNAVAPNPERNIDFSSKLATALGSKLGPAIPVFAIKALFGEMAHVLLSSQNIQSPKLAKLDFQFQYPNVEKAFAQIATFYEGGDEVFYMEQFLPAKRSDVFPFFAEAKNLEEITPPLLNFKVTQMSTPEIQSGTLIDYRLKIHGVPVSWRTEILDWTPISKFTDTQLKGPYKKWHHTHEFFDFAGGTLMTDLVRYKLPMGLVGWLAAGAFVAKDVNRIFAYRKEICADLNFKLRAADKS